MITVFVNNEKADINQADNITLTASALDLQDPSARGSFASYDITFPATPTNNRIFNAASSPHVDLFFLKPYNVTIHANGVAVVSGTFTIKKISDDGYTGYITYAQTGWLDFFQNSSLQDVDWSDELCQSQAFIQNTNRNGLTDKYCFPIVDYGNISEATTNGDPIYSSDLFPAVFIYPLLKDLFAKAGYTLKDTFFQDETNYNLILPFTNDDIILKDPTIQQEDTDLIETTTNTGAIVLSTTSWVDIPISTVDLDTEPMLNTAFGFYFQVPNEWNGRTCGNIRGFDVEINVQGTLSRIATSVLPSAFFAIRTLRNGVTVNTAGGAVSAGSPFNLNYLYTLTNLVGGETVQVQIIKHYPTDPTVYIQNASPLKCYATRIKVEKYDYEFLKFYLKKQLPDITPYELLMSLVQMYNLQIKTDEATKTIELVPYTTSILSNATDFDDWRGKCSRINNEIALLTDEMPQKYIYKYADASDYLCSQYQSAKGYPYGTKIINTGGKNTEYAETNIALAPTINKRVSVFYLACYWQGDYKNPTTATEFIFETGTEARICKYVQAREDIYGPVQIRSDTTLGYYALTPTPYYGTAVFEVNKAIAVPPLNPTFLNEFLGHNLQFSDMVTGLLREGLYKRWHEGVLQRILSGKKVTLRVKIEPNDFASPTLFTKRKLITVTLRGETYTVLALLNEIKDYTPNIEQLTNCEFLII